jgi:hypothetical protein
MPLVKDCFRVSLGIGLLGFTLLNLIDIINMILLFNIARNISVLIKPLKNTRLFCFSFSTKLTFVLFVILAD